VAEFFTGIQHVLGSMLAFFYELIPSFGISIILLTIAINVALFPLTLRQTRATRSFQAIQPEIKRIQKEYKDDKEAMQKELARVQKEAGATPGGCLLPMLIQLPIWFALFRVFRNVAMIAHGTDGVVPVIPTDSSLLTAIESGNTQFLGMSLGTTMADGIGGGLMAAAPYAVLLILMVSAQYVQQWYSQRGMLQTKDKSGSGGTQQVITRIMPLFIGFISWRFPAGLVLYWATSNLVRLGQQSLIFHLDGPPSAFVSADSDGDDEDDEHDKEGPSPKPPSISKKKKGRRRRRR
jgi:YidC/Oxa1 family membrane protein insertase